MNSPTGAQYDNTREEKAKCKDRIDERSETGSNSQERFVRVLRGSSSLVRGDFSITKYIFSFKTPIFPL